MKKIEMYTDGACSGNPGPGGWGTILVFNGNEKELSEGSPETTNNQMELTAVLEGLKALKEPCEVHITTDSQYVMKGALEWLDGWKSRGWKTATKKPVKNVDLWKEYDRLSEPHKITMEWVKGHAGHPMNERADTLAVNQRDFYKEV